ncbi:hypothetical protein DPMN_052227 [Dreissena polymorpha]|uniref:Uncharacterized protein n=1 Tax=Dreissena polymorpha TaxID=45954 RepID=A0A9D4CLC1_DREPO|nr:hypothetical protein DPMN_052227 [Dreissena polymorpha]
MSMSVLDHIRTSSIFRTSAECRCQSCSTFAPTRYSGLVQNVDVGAGLTFAPARFSGRLSNVDARAGSTFAQSRYPGLVSNVAVRAGSNFAPALYSEFAEC